MRNLFVKVHRPTDAMCYYYFERVIREDSSYLERITDCTILNWKEGCSFMIETTKFSDK